MLTAHQRILCLLAFLGTLFVTAQLAGWRDLFSLDALQANLAQRPLLAFGSFALLFTLGNLLQIPGSLFLIAAVLALGKYWGGLTTYLGATLSCALVFPLVRTIGGSSLSGVEHRLLRHFVHQLETRPIRAVTALRILFQTLPALNYTLALSSLRFRHYLLGTLLGLPLPIALYCLFFDALLAFLRVPV